MTIFAKTMPQLLADLGLVTSGETSAWAITDSTNQYRYALGRMWDDYFFDRADWWNHDSPRPLWVFGMLNPSKARHDVDDPTIRKCIGFAKRGGAGGFIVVNLMAYSETHPKNLAAAYAKGTNVVGEKNFEVLKWALSRPAVMGINVAAWGVIPPRLRQVVQESVNQFRMAWPKCFGLSAGGFPRHPLMLSYETALEDFR